MRWLIIGMAAVAATTARAITGHPFFAGVFAAESAEAADLDDLVFDFC